MFLLHEVVVVNLTAAVSADLAHVALTVVVRLAAAQRRARRRAVGRAAAAGHFSSYVLRNALIEGRLRARILRRLVSDP